MTKRSSKKQDQDEFIHAMYQAGVKPILPTKARIGSTQKSKESPFKRFRSKHEEEKDDKDHTEELSLDLYLPKVSGDQLISYKQTNISNEILRKLRKGEYNPESKLDLHGLTVAEAATTLSAYVKQCEKRSIRVFLLVHGKGHSERTQPILKNMVNQWLRQMQPVLAFSSALPRHGGTGAVYVLLKNMRRTIRE